MLDSLRLQLEERNTVELANQQSAMGLSFKEELQQVRHKLGPSIFNVSISTKTEKEANLRDVLGTQCP